MTQYGALFNDIQEAYWNRQSDRKSTPISEIDLAALAVENFQKLLLDTYREDPQRMYEKAMDFVVCAMEESRPLCKLETARQLASMPTKPLYRLPVHRKSLADFVLNAHPIHEETMALSEIPEKELRKIEAGGWEEGIPAYRSDPTESSHQLMHAFERYLE